MRFEPTLIVTRVIVERNDRAVYDEAFHEGVNVVRGGELIREVNGAQLYILRLGRGPRRLEHDCAHM